MPSRANNRGVAVSHKVLIGKGRYLARLAESDDDIARVLALRARVFRPGQVPASDADAFDPACRHVMVETRDSGDLVGCCRILSFGSDRDIAQSYSAQFYDLTRLSHLPGPLAEVGRLCAAPEGADADSLRLTWAALASVLDAMGARFLFGCTSFPGTDPGAYLDAFALLHDRHAAPAPLRPGVKAPAVFGFARAGANGGVPARGLRQIPPLLRSYLALGGWVSDHAVIDRDLGTLHVFTGLDVGAMPEGRKKLLRAMAGPS